jgi:hypothetical protein
MKLSRIVFTNSFYENQKSLSTSKNIIDTVDTVEHTINNLDQNTNNLNHNEVSDEYNIISKKSLVNQSEHTLVNRKEKLSKIRSINSYSDIMTNLTNTTNLNITTTLPDKTNINTLAKTRNKRGKMKENKYSKSSDNIYEIKSQKKAFREIAEIVKLYQFNELLHVHFNNVAEYVNIYETPIFISQFLLYPIKIGSNLLDQKYDNKYLTTPYEMMKNVQNLLTYFYNTCSIIYNNNLVVEKHTIFNPWIKNNNISYVISTLNHIYINNKYYYNYKPIINNPQRFSVEINNGLYKIYPELSDILSKRENYILPQTSIDLPPFLIGLCVTILKYFFNGEIKLLIYVPEENGRSINNSEKLTTIKEELNKLAFNLTYLNCFANIYYQYDCYNQLLAGENAAIKYLQNFFPEKSFIISFSGERKVLHN